MSDLALVLLFGVGPWVPLLVFIAWAVLVTIGVFESDYDCNSP